MTNVIGVRFKDGGKVYYFDPCDTEVVLDQYVIVETARGIECGQVSSPNHEVEDSEIIKPLKKMLRIATDKDIEQAKENRRKEEKAFDICQQKILDRQMEMKLVDVEYAFDGSKILFYFTADGRVDFRELVKDLAGVFRTRIELRQIGVRDEAKMLGGLGLCGREFCCSSFLSDFQPVSIRMAKDQGLPLNPTKISGACGRLMCCLKYEQEAYEDLIRTTLRQNSTVTTPDGRGTVIDVSLLTGYLKIRLEGENGEVRVYHKSDLIGGCRCQRNCAPKPKHEEVYEELKEEIAPIIEEEEVISEELEAVTDDEAKADAPHKRRRSRGPRRNKKPAAAGEQPKTEPAGEGESPSADEGASQNVHKRRRPRYRKRRPAGQGNQNNTSAE